MLVEEGVGDGGFWGRADVGSEGGERRGKGGLSDGQKSRSAIRDDVG